ncbi:carbohydrate ABC transporter permease [Paenibacillus contaminans]|uniref:Sugar ABC transporter permease n=1 Tax=Paenibacillus contaminans TaxID=450362 RepID=A0A329MDH3_9BACL|nr:sugar ABC transporter permease [Paenibacillus contaminans]RAV16693.1 sugar ABC transporter permease [Paenibacillus contaminans]
MVIKHKFWIGMFIAPTVIIFLMFYAYPLGTVIVTSFTEWHLVSPIVFNGFSNYAALFRHDPAFIASLFNTLIWLVLQCTVFVGLGVLVALVTMRRDKFSRFVKVVYLIPNMIAVAALARLFYSFFQPSYGLVNQFIQWIGFSDFEMNWYMDPRTAFLSVTLTSILFAGIITLIVSSEIAAIPASIYEAATIDGATGTQVHRYITLPMLRNIIATSLILASTGALKMFEVIYLTTNGGPGNQTMNLSLLLYKTAMSDNDYGYANAIGTVIFVLGIGIILFITKLSKLGQSHYLE